MRRVHPLWRPVMLAALTIVGLTMGGCGGPGRDAGFGSLELTPAPRPQPAAAPRDAHPVARLAARPVMDGRLAEWKERPALELTGDGAPVRGRAWLGWDADFLYLACEIVDPNHRNTGVAENVGLGNCVIFDFDGLFGTGQSSAERMAFALTRRGPVTSWDILDRDDPGACVIRKTGKDTYAYEIALNWHDVQPIAPGLKPVFGCDVLYQYLDGSGRRRCVRWRKGAGPDPRRRDYGAAALSAMPAGTAGTHLYVHPSTFSVDDAGRIDWSVLVATDKPLDGAELAVEALASPADAQPKARTAAPLKAGAGLHHWTARWNAKGAPGGRHTLRTTLRSAAGEVLATDFFRVSSRPRVAVADLCRKLEPLYARLAATKNRFYLADAASVDLPMETLRAHAGKEVDAQTAQRLERIARNAERVMRAMLDGVDYYAKARGFVVHGFRSPYDDTLQLYEVFVPKGYDPARKYPLIVNLHGAGGDDPLKMLDGTYTARYDPDPDWDFLQMMPFARGRVSYRGLGLTEVLDTIEYTQRRYNVDPDRITIKGFSMGGAGTWWVALHHPDVFAAASPWAGFTRYQDYDRIRAQAKPTWESALAMTGNPMFHIENAANLPVFMYHGGSDAVIPVENAYRIWGRLKELGGAVGFTVIHHYQHWRPREVLPLANQFLLRQRRDPNPRRVIYKTNHLHFHRAYWVRVERLADPLKMASVDCLKLGDATVAATVENVEALSLALGDAAAGGPAEITVNGAAVAVAKVPAGGSVFLERKDGRWVSGRPPGPADRVKQPGLSGPMDDAFYGRVLYVYGTQSKDAALTATLRRLAEERCGRNAQRKVRGRGVTGFYPAKADVDVTDDDLARSSLVLIGGPGENLITRKIAASLPVTFGRGTFSFRGRTYRDANEGMKFIHPNPLSPGRYVIVTAANSGAGYAKTTASRRRVPDWVITAADGVKQAGFFDNRWR